MADGSTLPSTSSTALDSSFEQDASLQSTQAIPKAVGDADILSAASAPPPLHPTIRHCFLHSRSILSLAAAGDSVFAGSQSGDILVYSLQTFLEIHTVRAHESSVLGLCLSQDNRLLISCASDRFIHILDTATFSSKASIYSTYDVGDIFCVSFCQSLNTIYLGSQNTSIQWFELSHCDDRPPPNPALHPSRRPHKFFDSLGPGGSRNSSPKPADRFLSRLSCRQLDIYKDHIHQFAHFGYVYCMVLVKGSNVGFPDQEILISGGGDGIIQLWSLDSEDDGRIHNIGKLDDGKEEAESILALAIEDTLLYSGRAGGEVDVWSLDTKQLVRAVKAFKSDVLSLSVGCGSLFVASESGAIKRYNERFDSPQTWEGHVGRALASVFTTHNGNSLYISGGSDDKTVVWNVEGGLCPSWQDRSKMQDEMMESLRRLVSFKTIAADPQYRTDCHRGASYLRTVFKRFGATTQIFGSRDDMNPLVFGKFRANKGSIHSSKRILFYGHYDVVPAENKQKKWVADPFTMTGIDGYFYGRGTSDNKGPVMAAIYACADLVSRKALSADVVFLIEGEEEKGSRGFETVVKSHKDAIGPISWILVANSYWLDDAVPCLTFGLRGVIHATIEVRSEHPNLHSGVDGSNLLDEPLKDLIHVMSKLSGPNGRIQLPGFYDAILPITAAEESSYYKVSRSILARNPSLAGVETLARSLMSRWRNPSLTVHGFKTSGSEKASIIPHMATVNISLRLVPQQEASVVASTLKAFIESVFGQMRSKNTMTVSINHQAEPWLGDPDNEIYRALENAVVGVWTHSSKNGGRPRRSTVINPPSSNPDSTQHRRCSSASKRNDRPATSSRLASNNSTSVPVENLHHSQSRDKAYDPTGLGSRQDSTDWRPLYIREGGSIPAIRFLEKEFGAPAAHLPCGQASDNAHLDNERMRVLNLLNSRKIFRQIFSDLPLK